MGLIVWPWDAKCGAVSVSRLAPTALVMYITELRLLYPEGMSFRGTPTSSVLHARLVRLNHLFNTLLLPARNQSRMNRLPPSL